VTVADQQGQFGTDHVYSQEGSYPVGVAIENAQDQIVGLGALRGRSRSFPPISDRGCRFWAAGADRHAIRDRPEHRITITVSLKLGAGDAAGGYLLVTPLNNPLAAPTANIVAYVASFDVRQFGLPADATAVISFSIPGQLL